MAQRISSNLRRAMEFNSIRTKRVKVGGIRRESMLYGEINELSNVRNLNVRISKNTMYENPYIGKTIKVAFKYVSSTASSASWEIKNFQIYKRQQ